MVGRPECLVGSHQFEPSGHTTPQEILVVMRCASCGVGHRLEIIVTGEKAHANYHVFAADGANGGDVSPEIRDWSVMLCEKTIQDFGRENNYELERGMPTIGGRYQENSAATPDAVIHPRARSGVEQLQEMGTAKTISLAAVSLAALLSLVLFLGESSSFDVVFYAAVFLVQVGVVAYLYTKWDEMSVRLRWGVTIIGSAVGVFAFAAIALAIVVVIIWIIYTAVGG